MAISRYSIRHRLSAAALLMFLLLLQPVGAQDALNLPADLYVLLNTGIVQRYGLGAEGVRAVTPEDAFVVDFGISPDGSQIAYRTENSINLQSLLAEDEPRIVEREADVPPYRGRGETIAWSPDLSAIAYTTTYGARVFFDLGEVAAYSDLREGLFTDLQWSPAGSFLTAQTDAGVWWIYRRAETTMVLASVIPISAGVVWVSDHQIVFAPPEGGLILMDLDQANAQTTILEATWNYALPVLDAEDQLRFFARDIADDTTPVGYGRLQSIARGAAEVVTRSETPVQTQDLRWAPGGNLLTAFDGGVLALFDPVTGQGFALPIQDIVAYTWGPFNPQVFFATQPAPPPIVPTLAATSVPAAAPLLDVVAGITLSDDAYFLAYAEFNQPQVWRLNANGSPAEPITSAPMGVSEYAVAPDQRSLVYVSEGQLWLYPLSTFTPVSLARIQGAGFVSPTFSPDSLQIAYADNGIRLIPVEGGEATLLLADARDAAQPSSFGEPKFSLDGTQLLVSELLTGTNGVHGIVNIADGSYQRLDTDFGARALWLTDGSVISFGYTPQSAPQVQNIVRFPSGRTAQPDVIYTLNGADRIETIIEGVRGEIRLIAQRENESTPQMIDVAFVTGEEAAITALPAIFAPRLSLDGGFIGGYLSQSVIDGIQQGPLTLYNANNGTQVLLGSPTSTWGFQWGR